MLGLNALTPTIFLDSQQARLLIADVLRSILPVLPCISLPLASTLSSLTPLIVEMATKFLNLEDRLLNGQFRDVLTGPDRSQSGLLLCGFSLWRYLQNDRSNLSRTPYRTFFEKSISQTL